jgi:hypothetical protein
MSTTYDLAALLADNNARYGREGSVKRALTWAHLDLAMAQMEARGRSTLNAIPQYAISGGAQGYLFKAQAAQAAAVRQRAGSALWHILKAMVLIRAGAPLT